MWESQKGRAQGSQILWEVADVPKLKKSFGKGSEEAPRALGVLSWGSPQGDI